MTITIKSERIGTDTNRYFVEIYQNKFETVWHVGAYISHNNGATYRTITDLTYTNIESAKIRYSYFKRKAKRNEL